MANVLEAERVKHDMMKALANARYGFVQQLIGRFHLKDIVNISNGELFRPLGVPNLSTAPTLLLCVKINQAYTADDNRRPPDLYQYTGWLYLSANDVPRQLLFEILSASTPEGVNPQNHKALRDWLRDSWSGSEIFEAAIKKYQENGDGESVMAAIRFMKDDESEEEVRRL